MQRLPRLQNSLSSSRTFSSSATAARNPITPYITTLRARYPSADPPSLIASFLILHELTAIVPLFAGFWVFKAAGVGAGLVAWAVAEEGEEDGQASWSRAKFRQWVVDGEEQAQKIGRRYGAFGIEKESKEQKEERRQREKDGIVEVGQAQSNYSVGGDVANLVAAYIATKVSSRPLCGCAVSGANADLAIPGSPSPPHPRLASSSSTYGQRHRSTLQEPT